MSIPSTTSSEDLLKSGDFDADSDVYGLRAGEPIAAMMGLETPQIVTRWRYSDIVPDIEQVRVRRSTYRFPESISEGDALLDEAQVLSNVRTSYADLTPDPSAVSYYSVFFQHKGPYSLAVTQTFEVERLGLIRHAVYRNTLGTYYWVFSRSEAGTLVMYKYNFVKELVEQTIDFSAVINDSDEQLVQCTFVNVVGNNYFFNLTTQRRYMQMTIPAATTKALTSQITSQFNLAPLMPPGYRIVGACPNSGGYAFLDGEHKKIITVDVAGVFQSSTDVSGFNLAGQMCGIQFHTTEYSIGFGKVIVRFVLAPGLTNASITSHYPVRRPLSIPYYFDGNAPNPLTVADNDLHWIQTYDASAVVTNKVQMEELTTPANVVKGIWRLDEATGAVIDSSGNGFNGVISGSPNRSQPGKFGRSLQLTDANQGVDLTSGSAQFNADNGYVSFWWKSPYKGYRAVTVPRLFFLAVGPSRNLLIYALTGGELLLRMTRNAVQHDITVPNGQSMIDDGQFHHISGIWSGGNGGTMTFYIDGVSVGSVALTNTSGAMTAMGIGGTGADAQLGYYDDLSIGAGQVFSHFTRYSLTTRGNRAHSLAGRDYTAEGQHWRDKFRFEFDEFPLRNDFDISALPSNQVLADGETILREPSARLTLGNLGKLSRLFGLFLDRITDYRKHFSTLNNLNKVEYEFISWLGETIGAFDVNEEWNVEKRRRFLETMFFCYQRSGTFDAFFRLARFLGFYLLKPDSVVGPLTQVYRGYFDSCVDPDRVDVPFDTITFDSSGDDTQLVDIINKLYIQNRAASVGSTSVPATRQLTDATANFTAQAEVGSLIVINDADTKGDNGQYIITNVNSATVVTIDRDFPVGSLTGLSYRLHWRVPPPDPYNDQVLARLNSIKVRWQNLIVNL